MMRNATECAGLVTVEAYGCWGEEARRYLNRLATRIATRTACPKSSPESERLSIALVRANARALLARSSSFCKLRIGGSRQYAKVGLRPTNCYQSS